jgi:DNA-binding transcriptional LysR family regulator
MDGSRPPALPPLSALQGFIAAVDRGSFSLAAEDVGRTQGAVSRQVALLEDWLGLQLFERVGRSVQPTGDARDYAAAIRPALDDIRRATTRAMERPPERELTIATLPSFGMRWLAPRLPGLAGSNPDIVVSFSARSQRFNFANERFDAAVHFGEPDWPAASRDLLFSEQMIPVVSPARLAEHNVSRPADLLRLPLLVLASRRSAWPAWFAAAGVADTVPAASTVFEHFMMLAQAAVSGAGAALIPSFLIEDELRSRALVRPFQINAPHSGSYYFVYPPDRLRSDAFRRFRAWLLKEARSFDSVSSPPV